MLRRWGFLLNILSVLGFRKETLSQYLRHVTAGIWVLCFCTECYFTSTLLYQGGDSGCLSEQINNTFSLYKTNLIITSHKVAKLVTGMFCCARLFRRNIDEDLRRGFSFYTSLAKDVGGAPLRLSGGLKMVLFSLYLLQFVLDVLITLYCTSKYDWMATTNMLIGVAKAWLITFLFIPPIVTVTVICLLLDVANEALDLLCKKIDLITATMAPKPFLEKKPIKKNSLLLSSDVNKELIFSLRKQHIQIVEFIEDVMDTFQADILVFLVCQFYRNVLYYYAVVYNTAMLFQSWDAAIMVLLTAIFSILLKLAVWILCAGPSRIIGQRDVLQNSIARLSTMPKMSSDVAFEVRMLQLQNRNVFASFSVYGMFKLNISLMFTMCTSIASYTVILIQFSSDPLENATHNFNNFTVTIYENCTQLP